MKSLRIAMAQINPTVGDISGNCAKIIENARNAASLRCDIVLLPELAITGYPPEDLLLKPAFIDDNLRCLREISKKIKTITAVVGFVDKGTDGLYNAAAVIHKGRVAGVYHKIKLPNYGVFDEERYFKSGTKSLNFVLNGVAVGVEICEDIWYADGPIRAQARSGAELIVNINASPYYMEKRRLREEMLVERATSNNVAIAYNNTVGGQDELIFDGNGIIIDRSGAVIARGAAFNEDLIVADMEFTGLGGIRRPVRRTVDEIILKGGAADRKKPRFHQAPSVVTGLAAEVVSALELGTRDYVMKNGFNRVVIGLSGGIDSALVAAIAVGALGSDNVKCVFMPSMYTSKESRVDAVRLAKNLNIELITISITRVFKTCLGMMKPAFNGEKPDTTEENLQARIRGNILMALSNKFGWLVLTTGNKSEMSVGYATLYGDMAGGFAVIKDVPKTLVYEISHAINERAGSGVIPERIFIKAPTAELKPGQTDQDTLPPYDTLDEILKAYVEDNNSLSEITALGYSRDVVEKVIRMVDGSEYKRRQAPPGIKITPRAFGKDRRMPITNRYKNG